MQANVIGRVRNTQLPKHHGLLPLYETIVNSIDAIEDTGDDATQEKIRIRILRNPSLPGLGAHEGSQPEKRSLNPIRGFEIEDTGIGFTTDNFDAFNESDTQFKAKKGGKGIGRFLWLKAFEKVEIESHYLEDGKAQHRTFQFSLGSPGGVHDHRLEQTTGGGPRRTVVRLLNFHVEYESQIPRSSRKIAQRIVEHCLKYYY